jgi:hypothetical protein
MQNTNIEEFRETIHSSHFTVFQAEKPESTVALYE